MKTRFALAAVGVVMVGWGAWLALRVPQVVEVGVWFVAGPVLHDALLAPVVAALGFVLKGPAKAGAVVSGVLVLVAVPLLWRDNAPVNPGLHDRDYLVGLAVTLAVVWVLVLLTAVARGRLSRTSTDEG